MSNENTNNTIREIPKIYNAICRVIGDVGAVTKDRQNQQQNYKYRSIDDVYNALNPALAKNGLIIIPNILEVTKEDKTTKSGTNMTYTTVRINYTFYSAEDGSSVNSEYYGEASDTGDKSINKAMASAYKYACFQVFCIPTEEMNEDADKTTPEGVKPKKSTADYVQQSYENRKDYIRSAGNAKPQSDSKGIYISEAQAKLLFAKSNKDIVKRVIEEFGYEKTIQIQKKDFDDILKKVVDEAFREKNAAEEISDINYYGALSQEAEHADAGDRLPA